MPTIHQNNLYTLVIEFETDPAKELIDGIAAAVEQSFRPDRRFVSASFHASDDGRRMLNYAQWTSQADYEAFMNDTSGNGTRTIGEVIQRCGAKPLGGHAYTVRRIVERVG